MVNSAQANIPVSIRQHLTQKNIAHALGPNKPTLTRAEVCLLKDDDGLVQLFIPSTSIVDIEQVRSITGRELKPLSLAETNQLKANLNIDTLPAFDDLLDAVTIIDARLYETERVLVHSGSHDHLMALKNGESMKRLESTTVADIGIRLPLDDVDYELSLFDHDRGEINDAVTKFTSLRIRQRVEETLEIPPLPDTAQAIIRLRVDPDANIEKLSQIVERDPSLAAQVVSWASSSFYSAPGSIKSVQDAIVRVLGFDLVMNLALGLSLGNTLDLPKEDDGRTPYWNQSVYLAACVGALTSAIPREFRPSFGLSYLAGLLHNFGYLVLSHAFKPHFDNLGAMIQLNRHVGHQHIEKHLLGITREQIASNLMHSWNLPNEVTLGVRYQTDPHYLGENSDQSNLIYLARHLLGQHGMLPKASSAFDDIVYEQLQLDPEKAKEVMETLIENQAELDIIASALTPN